MCAMANVRPLFGMPEDFFIIFFIFLSNKNNETYFSVFHSAQTSARLQNSKSTPKGGIFFNRKLYV